jgi:hypothetical protein
MTKPLTQKQVAYQKANSTSAAETATAAASLLPQSYCNSTERKTTHCDIAPKPKCLFRSLK